MRGARSLDFIVVVTTRAVEAGEELTISYGDLWSGDGSGGGGSGFFAGVKSYISGIFSLFSGGDDGGGAGADGKGSDGRGSLTGDADAGSARGSIMQNVPRAATVTESVTAYFSGRAAWRTCFRQCEMNSFDFPMPGIGSAGQVEALEVEQDRDRMVALLNSALRGREAFLDKRAPLVWNLAELARGGGGR